MPAIIRGPLHAGNNIEARGRRSFGASASPGEFANEMRLAAAIRLVQAWRDLSGKVAQVAGLSRTDFLLGIAREDEDAFVVDFADLERELQLG
jgi:uncharacterized protein UPF0175